MGVNAAQHLMNQAPFRSTFNISSWLLLKSLILYKLILRLLHNSTRKLKKRKRNVHLNGTWCKTFGVLLQWRKNVSQIFHLVYLKRSDSLKSLLRFNSLQKVVVCNENFIEIYFSTKKLIFHFFQKSSQISTNDF